MARQSALGHIPDPAAEHLLSATMNSSRRTHQDDGEVYAERGHGGKLGEHDGEERDLASAGSCQSPALWGEVTHDRDETQAQRPANEPDNRGHAR